MGTSIKKKHTQCRLKQAVREQIVKSGSARANITMQSKNTSSCQMKVYPSWELHNCFRDLPWHAPTPSIWWATLSLLQHTTMILTSSTADRKEKQKSGRAKISLLSVLQFPDSCTHQLYLYDLALKPLRQRKMTQILSSLTNFSFVLLCEGEPALSWIVTWDGLNITTPAGALAQVRSADV